MDQADSALSRLIASADAEADAGFNGALAVLRLPDGLAGGGGAVSRAQVAMALNVLLYADLLRRVPTARRYVAEVRGQGDTIVFDHGALRTVDGPAGALPRGFSAFARLLEPLGYQLGGVYPLPRLRMTGRAFVHRDLPEAIPQFFVSELHIDRLADEAQAAARRVFDASADPLGAAERTLLDQLVRSGECALDVAARGLPGLVRAFGRQHPTPNLDDYEALLRHSAEAAWIATEGNAFNHATDRVADVGVLAASLRDRGYPMKPDVEVSANGRVRQTAFLADRVMRSFRVADGSIAERAVPGSFYEFITRDVDPATGGLDLTFDSGNATGIFAVTSAT